MAEALEIIFRSFWTWSGSLILFTAVAGALSGLISINIVRKNKKQAD